VNSVNDLRRSLPAQALSAHPSFAQPSLWQKCLAGMVIFAGLACTVGGISINFYDRYSLAPGTGLSQRQQGIELYAEFDRNMELLKENCHGVFIRFLNFQGEPGSAYPSQFTLNIYFRAVYDLYPFPVCVGYSDVAMNTALQVLSSNGKPDVLWMSKHGLDAELTVSWPQFRMQLRSLDSQKIMNLPSLGGRPMILPPSLSTR
jgi:hypothetical protein